MVVVALAQSVVLLHGACCLRDQLLSWACSPPATSVNSEGVLDPHEDMLEVSEAIRQSAVQKAKGWGCWRLRACQTHSRPLMAIPE